MSGSIKIQHGGTAATPQAGFSTLYVSSTDGEFYVKKPNGQTESLVGPTGATGATGATPATLAIKNIQFGGTSDWVYDPSYPVLGASSYYDVTFATPFADTNYTTDFFYKSNAVAPGVFWANSVAFNANVDFQNKTTAGVRVVLTIVNLPANGISTDTYNLRATEIGETP